MNNLSLIDDHIKNRLELIKLGGESIQVYEYEDFRDEGLNVLPCVAIERQNVRWNQDKARPCHYVYEPASTASGVSVTIPQELRGPTASGITTETTVSGYSHYQQSPYPIPVEVDYQVDLYCSTKAHMDNLIFAFMQVLPLGYQAQIDGEWATIVFSPPVNLSELEDHLFRHAIRFTVQDIWVDQLPTRTVPTIKDIEVSITPTYN